MSERMPYTHDPFACRVIYKQELAWYHAYKATSVPKPKPKKCPYGCNG